MDSGTIFNASKEIYDRRRNNALLALFIVFFFFPFAMEAFKKGTIFCLSLKSLPVIYPLGLTVVFVLASIILATVAFRRQRSYKIKINEADIEHFAQNSREKILFSDVKHVAIIKNPNGKIESVVLATDKVQLGISGFENIDTIVDFVQKRVSGSAKIVIRKHLADWDNPITIISSTFLIVFVYSYPFARLLNSSFYEIINLVIGVFLLIFGFSIIKFRVPRVPHGIRYRKSEILLGILLMSVGLFWLYSNILK